MIAFQSPQAVSVQNTKLQDLRCTELAIEGLSSGVDNLVNISHLQLMITG